MSDTFGAFTFNGNTKIISLSLGTYSFNAGEIYSRWKQWCSFSDNAKYPPAFAGSVGGEALGSNLFVGGYFFLQNGWVIRPMEADHQLIVSGNLFPIPDTAALFTSTLGDFQVIVGMRVSSLTQQVVSSSGGGSSPTAAQIADAVWSEDTSTYVNGAGKTLTDVGNNTSVIPGLL